MNDRIKTRMSALATNLQASARRALLGCAGRAGRRIALLAAASALAFGVAAPAQAAEGGAPLDHFPADKLTDLPSLQDGARTFVNYCLNCHSASMMRYNRLKDIGLTDDQIVANLMFTATKVGDPMTIAMRPADAKTWFGAMPPDLSVIARARSSADGSGADWLYTYLRSYYRDNGRATGWNNALFANVGMPHVLWELQGSRGATIEEIKAGEGGGHGSSWVKTIVTFDNDGNRSEKTEKLEGYQHAGTHLTLTPAKGGTMSQANYDEKVANLVAYVAYMSDPSAKTRARMGVWVLIFLSILIFVTWWLNREFWKDIK
ncbi:MAG: cytochrome c1 [Lautropia sp.]